MGLPPLLKKLLTKVVGDRRAVETKTVQTVEQGVSGFYDGLQVFVKALDELQKVHPFVAVAVIAFKTVYTLEEKRRDNDKKIIALNAEIKNMMAVLFSLKDVKDPTDIVKDPRDIGSVGQTIEGRVQGIMNTAAEDIKKCGHACDTYSKKAALVKFFNGPMWETRLVKFCEIFMKHKCELEYALAIHTARGVDEANRKLDNLDQMIKTRMDEMMAAFKMFVTPEQEKVANVVKKCGPEVNEALLDEVKIAVEGGNGPTGTSGPHHGNKSDESSQQRKDEQLEELREELADSPDQAMKKNSDAFLGKFNLQQEQLEAEIKKVGRQTNRILVKMDKMESGPHDRVLDEDVHQLWKEMGWRGSVKARHFVLGLLDHYCEKAFKQGQDAAGHAPNPDAWALTHFNVTKLQPIKEAFDDDGTGFITVQETNKFTSGRPRDWSLPHWLAFWAVGWQMSLTAYAQKINDILAKMMAIQAHVLLKNLSAVDRYLNHITNRGIHTFTYCLEECDIDEALMSKFQSFIDEEEGRLRKNLEAVKYDLDAFDTLGIVTGDGRIEKFVMPLLYLLLSRHYEILRIACTTVIHSRELVDAAGSFNYLFRLLRERSSSLLSIFTQLRLDPKVQFTVWAHGMLRYVWEPMAFWATEKSKEFRLHPVILDEADYKETPDRKILKFTPGETELPPQNIFIEAPLDSRDPSAGFPLGPLLGCWTGDFYKHRRSFWSGMTTVDIHAAPSGSPNDAIQKFDFQGQGADIFGNDFKISGSCWSNDENRNIVHVRFNLLYEDDSSVHFFSGFLDIERECISGKWGLESEEANNVFPFEFHRNKSEKLRAYLDPIDLTSGQKSRYLWKFAISATLNGIRRSRWSWFFFKARREDRERWIDLWVRKHKLRETLEGNDAVDFMRLRKQFTAFDHQYCLALCEERSDNTVNHGNFCDNCKDTIVGVLSRCLMCPRDSSWGTIDLCNKSACLTAEISREKHPSHVSTHDMLKARRVQHTLLVEDLESRANHAVRKGRDAFEESADFDESTVDKVLCCAGCQHRLAQPCWYCADCEDDTFICVECDEKGVPKVDKHTNSHILVTCKKYVALQQIPSMEDRLVRLENRSQAQETLMNERFTTIDDRLTTIDDRFTTIEKLLENMIMHVGGGTQSPSLTLSAPQGQTAESSNPGSTIFNTPIVGASSAF